MSDLPNNFFRQPLQGYMESRKNTPHNTGDKPRRTIDRAIHVSESHLPLILTLQLLLRVVCPSSSNQAPSRERCEGLGKQRV